MLKFIYVKVIFLISSIPNNGVFVVTVSNEYIGSESPQGGIRTVHIVYIVFIQLQEAHYKRLALSPPLFFILSFSRSSMLHWQQWARNLSGARPVGGGGRGAV